MYINRSKAHIQLLVDKFAYKNGYKAIDVTSSINSNCNSIAMNNPTPTEQLQKLLILTSNIGNMQEIKLVESYIQQNRLSQGFVPCLIQIITKNLPGMESNNSCYHLVLASMVELKNVMRTYWHPPSNTETLNENDKEYFISKIIDLNFRLYNIPNQAMSYKFCKLMKDIIEITRCASIKIYKEIVGIIEQANTMEKFQRLPFCLNILLGWSFQQFATSADHGKIYTAMTKQIHPLLLDFIREGNNIIQDMYDKLTQISDKQEAMNFLKIYGQVKRKFQEILYLSIKLACKASGFDGIEQYRELTLEWADVAITKIRHCYVPQEYCEKNQATGMGVKGNDRFNFYHGKKWALKFLYRFFERVLVLRNKNPTYNQLTIDFYQRNLETILEIFREGWERDEPQHIRYQQLRCFSCLVTCKYRYFSLQKTKEMELYLSKILPVFIKITERQLAIIQEDPVEFIIYEGQTTHFTASVKSNRMMATDLWLRIAKLAENLAVDQKNPLLSYSFALIKSWTEVYDTNTLVLRDIGCYLLSKLTLEFERIKPIQSDLVNLLDRIIRHNMTHPTHFLHIARALDLANSYSRILPQALKEFLTLNIIELYKNLHIDLNSNPQPSQIFILIKCCLALKEIIYAIQLSQSDLFLIIFTNFQLIKLTSFEDIIRSVDAMLDRFIGIVPGFALQIIQHIKNWFREYARAQISERMDYRKQESYISLANGVMSVLTTLTRLCATRDGRIIEALESEIISVSGFVLSEKEEAVVEYKEGAIDLMSTYLFWYPVQLPLTRTMHTLCKKHMLKMAGLQENVLTRLENKIQEMENTGVTERLSLFKFYLSCDQTASYNWSLYIIFMRSYIKFIPFGEPIKPIEEISNQILSSNNNQTQLFMYVVYQFFVAGQEEYYESTCVNSNTALVFLILYYDYNQIVDQHPKVHQSVNTLTIAIIQHGVNIQIKYPKISTYLVQLFSMWMLEVKDEMFGFFNNWDRKRVKHLFNNIFVHDSYYGLPQILEKGQKARCIQGISVLLRLAVDNEQLWKIISGSISGLVKYAIDFTQEILIPRNRTSKDELQRWRMEHLAYEKRRQEEMTMPEANEATEANEANEELDDAPMVLQPHSYNYDEDYSSDQQDLFQALTYDKYVCPLLQQEEYHIHLLKSLYLLYQHNQHYYTSILNEYYADKLQRITLYKDLIDNPDYQHFVDLFDAYFGELIQDYQQEI